MRPPSASKTGIVLLPTNHDDHRSNHTKNEKKIELLSPELMETIKKSTQKPNQNSSNQQEHQQQHSQHQSAHTNNHDNNLEKFDFDSFTLESLRTAELAHLQREVDQLEHLFHRSVLLERSSTCDTISIGTSAADDPPPFTSSSFETIHFHPQQQQQRRRSRSNTLFSRPQLNNRGRYPQSQSQSYPLQPSASQYPRMCGWLYRLHQGGLMMVKRWRLQYCLLKGDKLCVYTTEDTINGKLKACFHIHTVYTEEQTCILHVIGEDSSGHIWHETFRTRDHFSYQDWTFHLREFIMVDNHHRRPTIDLGVDILPPNNNQTNETERRHSSVHPHYWSTKTSSEYNMMENVDEDEQAFDFLFEDEEDIGDINNNMVDASSTHLFHQVSTPTIPQETTNHHPYLN